MTSHSWDLVGLGDCGVDIFVRVNRLPSWDEKVPANLLRFEGGGVAANFCCAAARMGLETSLISSVGNDMFGDIALQSLRAFGVDADGVAVRTDAETYFCTVSLDDRGEKALTIVRTEAFYPRSEDLDRRRLVETRMLHIAPFDFVVATEAARIAKQAGVQISLDLEPAMVGANLGPALELLGLTDVLFVNDLTVEALFHKGAYREAALALSELGPSLVIVTRGSQGAYARSEMGEMELDAFAVNSVDTTGAGDCFNAAFLASRAEGLELGPALRFASAAAALSIQTIGARSGLPTKDAVLSFLGAQELS